MSDEELSFFEGDLFQRRLSIITNFSILTGIIIFALISLESVLKPLVIALGVYFILKPGADALNRTGFNVYLSYLTVLLLFVLIIVSSSYFAYSQIDDLVDNTEKMDEYESKLEKKYTQIKSAPLVGSAFNSSENGENTTMNDNLEDWGVIEEGCSISDIFVEAMAFLASFATTAITVLFFLIFIIFEAGLLPARIMAAYPGAGADRINEIRRDIEKSINVYIIVKTGVGLGTAFCAGILLVMFDIDLWFLWLLLTFLMNYVPYIGSLIATIPPLLLGLILLSPGSFVLLLILLLVNQQIWGNIIETKWTGSQLDISPVLLLVVVALGWWIWGIIGMIISVPFVVIIKIVLENIQATRPLAVLMSEQAPTYLEAYQTALSDGIVTEDERKHLKLLQEEYGITDKRAKKEATLAALNIAIRGVRVVEDEEKLVLGAAREYLSEDGYLKVKDALSDQRFSELEVPLIEEILKTIEVELEEE